VELEITPEPSDAERAAIVAALVRETPDELPPPPEPRPPDVTVESEGSVRP